MSVTIQNHPGSAGRAKPPSHLTPTPAMETTLKFRRRHSESPAPGRRLSNRRPASTHRSWQERRAGSRPPARTCGGNPGFRPVSPGTPAWKRTFDIGFIVIILPVILVLALLVFFWIKVVSPGPVLFRQTRIGRGGKPFTIYKFRSMTQMADTCPHEAHVEQLIKSNQPMTKLDLSGDPRVIPGCRMIRTSGLDELPQVINVLRGEMSLVGPRPCTPNEFALYETHQLRRFSLQPGLTGLWQVKRTHSTTFREMVAMDDRYADRLSLALDCRIVLETPGVLVRQLGTCLLAPFLQHKDRPGAARSSSEPSGPVRPHSFGNGMRTTRRTG